MSIDSTSKNQAFCEFYNFSYFYEILDNLMTKASLLIQLAPFCLSAASVLGVLGNRNRAEFPDAIQHAQIEDRVIRANLSCLG